MKKKLLALLIAVSCVCTMTACGKTEDVSAKAEAQEDADEEDEEEEEEEEEKTRKADRKADKDEEDKDEEKEEEEKEDKEEKKKDKEDVEKEDAEKEAEEEKEKEEKEAGKSKASVSMPSELSDDIYDFQIAIDGTVYQFPMWYSDFEALGWEFDGDNTLTLDSNQYSLSDRWKKDGVSVYTQFANLSMNSTTYAESMVTSFSLDEYGYDDCGWEIVLPGGIQWGVSTTEDIIAAYGDPTSDYDGDLYYKMTYEYDIYSDISLYVYKESNVLEKIELQNMVELEGADNSVDSTVPDVVKNYQAPSSLGDDLYSFNVEVEGNVYTLPCPVSVFIENGFEIDEKNSEMAIGAGSFGWVDLKYNNQTLHGIVHNYADYATTPENCFVTTVESNDYGADFDVVFPCGITRGDTEESVEAAVADFNFEKEVSDSGYTYYSVYDPNGSKLDSYDITIKDGVVISLEVENSEEPEQ